MTRSESQSQKYRHFYSFTENIYSQPTIVPRNNEKVKIRYQLQSLKLTFRIEINFKSTVPLHFYLKSMALKQK